MTDHVPLEPRLITLNAEEDQDFFDYEQAVDSYNSNVSNQSLKGSEAA